MDLYKEDFQKRPKNFIATSTIEEATYPPENFNVEIAKLDHNLGVDESENIDLKYYSPHELAKYFGVSVVTINLWMDGGRFVDSKKPEKLKQAKIKETTLWKTPSGKCIPVKYIVEMWQKQYKELTEEDEIKILKEELCDFEKTYGGPYEKTLKLKENKNGLEERISEEWNYIVRRLSNE